MASIAPYDGFKAATPSSPIILCDRYPKHIEMDFSRTSYIEQVSGAGRSVWKKVSLCSINSELLIQPKMRLASQMTAC